jgi:hypothetical protein
MLFVGAYQCDNASDLMASLNGKSAKADELKNKIDREFNRGNESYNMLILESGNGLSLADAMDIYNRKINSEQLRVILFQTLYTLLVFYNLGFRHNDLHAGNVFVTTSLPTASNPLIYFINELTYYVIPQNGVMCKMFDYDNSTIVEGSFLADMFRRLNPNFQGEVTNVNDEFCELYGMCGETNKYYDMVLILMALTSYINKASPEDKEVYEFIKDMIDVDKINNNFTGDMFGRLCNAVTFGKNRVCDGELPESVVRDSGVAAGLVEALNSKYFSNFRHELYKDTYNRKYLPEGIIDGIDYEHVYFASIDVKLHAIEHLKSIVSGKQRLY